MPDLDEEVVFCRAKELRGSPGFEEYLDSVSASTPALRCRIERLLGLEAQANEFFRLDAFPRIEAESVGSSNLNPTELLNTEKQNNAAFLATVRRFGDYELLEEIARGGMGVVYKARQVSLDRLVAVKMLLLGPLAGREFVQRFRAEALAAASLRHPNIVAVHEVGVHQDQHYLVMDYITGSTLAKLSGGQPLAPKRAADYVMTIAAAIHFAHEHGVLHRDLKPSNVLVDHDDEPHVTDFGMAKRQDADSSLTVTGQLIGTPSYMAPEQARGKRGEVGPYSDVYSLGAILFHLLTGRPPFVAESINDTIQMVLEQEPIAPRTLVLGIPRNLDTICLKCLRKEPGRRYATAQELAAELVRFLNNEPIHARRISGMEKLWRWCCRSPAVASFGAATVALALAIVVGSPIAIYRINAARKDEATARARAEQSASEARRNLYIANLNLAQHAWEHNNNGRARQLLNETASGSERGFEWYYWRRQMHSELLTLRGHTEEITSVSFSRDGQRIVTGSSDRTARVWDASSAKELLTLTGHSAGICSVAISPDGERIATGSLDYTAKLWETATGNEMFTLRGHGRDFVYVAFSPDSRRIVTGSDSGRVWDAVSGRELLSLREPGSSFRAVAFSPDGKRILTGNSDGTARVWDAFSGGQLLILGSHGNMVRSVAFSPDGGRILTGSDDRTAKVWDVATGKELLTFQAHGAEITSVAISPDGQCALTGSEDRTARMWDVLSGNELICLKGHRDLVNSVAFSPDGQRILTGSADLTAKLWNVTTDRQAITLKGHTNAVNSVAFSSDGRRVLTGSKDKTARVWDVASGKELMILDHRESVGGVAFSPDGQQVVTCGASLQGGFVKVWEPTAGKELFSWKAHDKAITGVAFSPEGKNLATCSDDRTAKVWQASNGQQLLLLLGHTMEILSVSYSPDGSRIVTTSLDRTAKVWDAISGANLFTLGGFGSWVVSARFSPDGKRIVTGCGDQSIKVWDVTGRTNLLSLEGLSGQVWPVIYSPDGKRIIAGTSDGIVKLFETQGGKELLTLTGHSGAIRSVAMSSDGRRIVSGSWDHSAKVWEAATPQHVEAWDQEEKAAAERLAIQRHTLVEAAERDRALRAKDPGAIKEWLVLAAIPIQDRNVTNALDAEQIEHEADLHPWAGKRVMVGASELTWRREHLEDYLIDFNKIMSQITEWSVAYAVCYVNSESSQTNLSIKVGSDDVSKIYLNGKQVCRCEWDGDYIADRETADGVALESGLNVLVFKVVNGPTDWRGSVRFTDAMGHPLKGIKITLDPDG